MRPDPYPGVRIISVPEGKRLIGYELIVAPSGVFCPPDPAHMAPRGWFSSLALLFVCWPLTCVPMCMSCSYETCQRPVYED